MAAPIIDLAEALLPILNHAAAPGNPLAAVRVQVPRIDLAKVTSRRVFVVPANDETTGKADRSRWSHTLTIHVAIYEKLASEEHAACDPLTALADQIAEYLKANRPARPEKLMGCTLQTLFDPAALKEHNVFSTAVTTTWQNVR